MMRGKGEELPLLPNIISAVGVVKPDTFNGGFFLDASAWLAGA